MQRLEYTRKPPPGIPYVFTPNGRTRGKPYVFPCEAQSCGFPWNTYGKLRGISVSSAILWFSMEDLWESEVSEWCTIFYFVEVDFSFLFNFFLCRTTCACKSRYCHGCHDNQKVTLAGFEPRISRSKRTCSATPLRPFLDIVSRQVNLSIQ
jgi:hypothetical protein